MKTLFISLVSMALPLLAQAGELKCEYNFSGSPMGTIDVGIDDKGLPSEYATVSLFFAGARWMPVSNETPEAGQMLRLILSKDDPNNEVHMTVFPPQGNTYNTKLINPAAPPMMKELSGTCQLL